MDKYKVVAEDIINKINDNTFTIGQRLPTETLIAKQYNVSRHTIRKAFEHLSKLGYVRTRQGSGSFVANEYEYRNLDINSFSDTFKKRIITNEVIYFTTIDSCPHYVNLFGLPDGNKYRSWGRLRYLDNSPQPTQLEYTLSPYYLIPDFNENDLNQSFYRYVEEKSGYKIDHALKEIEAVALGLPEADYFQVPVGTPAILIRIIGYLTNGEIFEVSTNYHLNQTIKYYAKKI